MTRSAVSIARLVGAFLAWPGPKQRRPRRCALLLSPCHSLVASSATGMPEPPARGRRGVWIVRIGASARHGVSACPRARWLVRGGASALSLSSRPVCACLISSPLPLPPPSWRASLRQAVRCLQRLSPLLASSLGHVPTLLTNAIWTLLSRLGHEPPPPLHLSHGRPSGRWCGPPASSRPPPANPSARSGKQLASRNCPPVSPLSQPAR